MSGPALEARTPAASRAGRPVGPPAPQPRAPLRIGPIEVTPPVVLAPMAGVTNAPFRAICRAYGAGLYVSEMVTARGLVEGHERSRALARSGAGEAPRSVQLYGTDPSTMAAATRWLVDDTGIEHIDVNFGCPVRKVTRHGGGAALPLQRRRLARILEATVEAAGAVPVTAKFRIGIDDARPTSLDTGCIAAEAGCAAVALHARTAEQLYSGRADWGAIAALRSHVRTIPVLGNGDIWVAADALAMMRLTGCDGVVIGRGCLGRPWLFRDLADALAGRPPAPVPRLGEVAGAIRAHAALAIDWFGPEVGVRDFRKHTGWYLHGYPVGAELRRRLHQVSTVRELDDLLDRMLDQLGDVELPADAVGLPRGHQHGPKPVTLPAAIDRMDELAPLDVAADAPTSGG